MLYLCLCLLFVLSTCEGFYEDFDEFNVGAHLHNINVMLNLLVRTNEKTSCVISGRSYSKDSQKYKQLPKNSINDCAEVCCQDKACNYWSFGWGGDGQGTCILYSYINGSPEPAFRFASGEKGCPGVPKPIDSCLLTNTEITTPPMPSMPHVNNYVDCSKLCTEDDGCKFWSFESGPKGMKKHGPGICHLHSNGDKYKTNNSFISGKIGCPSSNSTCDVKVK